MAPPALASATLELKILQVFVILHVAHPQHYNPSILQDSRDLPKTDGRFGFLYRTEDGIAHAAKSEGDGVVHGRYTYTDPTGFKLNFNYNAGTRVTPGYSYDQPVQRPTQQAQYQQQDAAQDYGYQDRGRQEEYYVERRQPEVRQEVRSRPPALRSRNDLFDNNGYYQ